MAIDPEVIPPYSSQGRDAVKRLPKWAVFGAGGVFVFFIISFLKAFFPLMVMGFLLTCIWKQANKSGRY